MALITIVYGIKFALRGEELVRQQELAQWGGINVTYYDDNESLTTMMSFELNISAALEREFVTREELAMEYNVSVSEVYLYVNDTVEIVRPVVEAEQEGYGGTEQSTLPR